MSKTKKKNVGFTLRDKWRETHRKEKKERQRKRTNRDRVREIKTERMREG